MNTPEKNRTFTTFFSVALQMPIKITASLAGISAHFNDYFKMMENMQHFFPLRFSV